jgi:PPK2 family polyphosphate:nucleotide phosphotransferase
VSKLKPSDFHNLVARHRVDDGKKFRLEEHDPDDTGRFGPEDKDECQELLRQIIEWLAEAQERLYAQDQWALLLIFQAMDAAGKDGAIRHVMSGVNPQGCQVYSFKAPSPEELDHDYLWRCSQRMPERGRIGIFNRSYYEEVLAVRVRPEFLAAQKLPPTLVTDDLWEQRHEDIRNFERFLGRNGTLVRKFFLHVSKKEQKKRFVERLEQPEKNWKFSMADAEARRNWKEYQAAYEDAIRNTSTPSAPWIVVPADHKWYTRLIVAAAIVDALVELDLKYPKLGSKQRKALEEARQALESEGG